jgi:hypothetical protein
MPSLKTLRHQEVLFTRLVEDLTQVRIDEPERALQVAEKRKRRKKFSADGRLSLLSADYPARGLTHAGDQPMAIADRQDFLIRIVRILSADVIDGIMSTMDVLEELLVLHDLMQLRGLTPFLNNKLLIVGLNRGTPPASNAIFDDPPLGPTPKQCAEWNMDGVKMLWRSCENERGSLETLKHCSRLISEANAVRLPVFLEPVPMVRCGDELKTNISAESLAQLVGSATALGDSSRYLYLVLPYCQNFQMVAMSTTLPILLAGTPAINPDFADTLKEQLVSAHNVRGVMAGRQILYPAEIDPVDAALTLKELVHRREPPIER